MAATRWRNWSGSVRAEPDRFSRPGSVDEVVDLVRGLAGRRLRIVGSGHAFSPVAAGDQVMATLADLPVVVEPGPDRQTVTVSANATLRQLHAGLDAQGLAVHNAASSDRQTVAGALATGTHGTGVGFGPLHADVEGVELVDGRGQLRWVDSAELPAARLALGALGVMTRIRLGVRPSFRLATHVAKVALDDVLVDLDHHVADHRHAQFDWVPHTPWTRLALADATEEPAPPTGPVARLTGGALENAVMWSAGQVARTFPGASAVAARAMSAGIGDLQSLQPSHTAFSTTRWGRMQMMEYALPRAALGPALEALSVRIHADGLPAVLPVTVRVVAADTSAWLSPAWARDTATIAVQAVRGMPYTRYFRAAEQVFCRHGGRPHWGAIHTLTADVLEGLYPRWQDFQAARAASDPDGLFTSPHLTRVLG